MPTMRPSGLVYTAPLHRRYRNARGLCNCVEYFFSGFRMQRDAGMKRNDDPPASLLVDSVTAF